ncbi:NUDIX domain-containing protein [Bradyrhizobium centrosematis]|uniref:NUDIX domain-containing protein n=1 Tax=Bradyrhizobium centrosematis TaxID=1300039 RepID=UPI0021688B8D|nr:NUDIX domain-containing protein [Bradyrhizobium centrosematis]MCS3765338.1 8-oxo-dGTP pyrophosphatase MutT (NUDIX family) [Bradyrhizobium centrosematis]MCS3773962.1 8-oxo-dGTP pyrophosphatase MutT (NUDIX family) [Bradyrhizobium centrosematis]
MTKIGEVDSVPARKVAAALLIEGGGRLLLQLRDDLPGILQPGKIGLFGGHREVGESALECAVREIREEIGCRIRQDEFEHVMSLDGLDPEIQGGRVKGEFYVVRNISLDRLIISEGKLLILSVDEILNIAERLTPIASIVVDQLIRCGRLRLGLGKV